jgi:hypothetical protein
VERREDVVLLKERGRLDLSKAQREVRLGERLEFIVPHCDPIGELV